MLTTEVGDTVLTTFRPYDSITADKVILLDARFFQYYDCMTFNE